MARRNTGSSSPGSPSATSLSGGGDSLMWAKIFATSASRSKGTRPVTAW